MASPLYYHCVLTQNASTIKKTFDLFDTDGDGKIEAGRLKVVLKMAMRALGSKPDMVEIQNVISDLDDDESGAVGYQEVLGMMRILIPCRTDERRRLSLAVPAALCLEWFQEGVRHRLFLSYSVQGGDVLTGLRIDGGRAGWRPSWSGWMRSGWCSLAAWPSAGWMARVHWNGDEARAKSMVFGAPTFYAFGFFTAKLVHMGQCFLVRGYMTTFHITQGQVGDDAEWEIVYLS